MDIETAIDIYMILDCIWTLNERQQKLYDKAYAILKENNLVDDCGRLIKKE